jgi:hypothetical protein
MSGCWFSRVDTLLSDSLDPAWQAPSATTIEIASAQRPHELIENLPTKPTAYNKDPVDADLNKISPPA